MQMLKDNHMLSVGCPNCAKLYQIPQSALGDKGRTMKCKACGEKWFCTTDHIQNPYEDETPVLNTPKAEISSEQDPWDSSTPEMVAKFDNKDEIILGAQSKALSLTTKADDENPFESSSLISNPLESRLQKSFKFNRNDGIAGQYEDIESQAEPLLAAQRAKRKINFKTVILQPNYIAAIALALILLIFLALPSMFVGLNPSYAKLYSGLGYTINTQGLAIDNLSTRLESDKAGTFLKVEGDITNITQETKTVPRIKLSVKNKDGGEVCSWVFSATKPTLLSGETIRFRSNYAEPSLDTTQIEARFLNGANLKK